MSNYGGSGCRNRELTGIGGAYFARLQYILRRFQGISNSRHVGKK